ncbi:G-patch domain and KOW motifs-containing protein isoform X2 [Phymastichus coffea]|uniref:G-patch domain and KOW motifs-containing protein isoform X2 n=1 Tax=Phymastichus coffea TaxID=108790 RepID=UPI00273C4128|nr:G-patch domain and KOW motifs-containing protein isoform X2 [Phymastichus coffea]
MSCEDTERSAMADEGKKISFGFSKTVKKPLIKNAAPVEEKAVDYIDCVDDKAIKIVGKEDKKDEPLVIPMLGSKTWHDRIINKVDADIFEPKKTDTEIKKELNKDIKVKEEKNVNMTNGNAKNGNVQLMEIDSVKIKEEPKDPEAIEPITLEQQAAQEILADLKEEENKSKEQTSFTVPMADDDLKGREESTLEDYEKIPIEAFGMAMLRGMGWKAEEGVGKNAKVVAPSIPEVRPKGMGLGADKLAIQKTKAKLTKEEENLKIVQGCCVKIIAGKQNGNYGKIEGLDEDTGRILVRLALGNEVISLVNEILVQPVTNEEYSKNSRVLTFNIVLN